MWIRVEVHGQPCWIVGDAFFNLARTPRNAVGVFLRLPGTTPGLRIGQTFEWVRLGDATSYRRRLLEQIEWDSPRLIVPAHGEIVADENLPARLRDLAVQRL